MKPKTEIESQFNVKFGEKLKKIKRKLRDNGLKISYFKIAEALGVSDRTINHYVNGDVGLKVYNLYLFIKKYELPLEDIAFLFDITPKSTLPQTVSPFSDNPKINEKILILKQIYESGDKILISSVDYCLKGAYDDFLKKQKKEIA